MHGLHRSVDDRVYEPSTDDSVRLARVARASHVPSVVTETMGIANAFAQVRGIVDAMRVGLVLATMTWGCTAEPHDYGGHFHIELAHDDANHTAVVAYEAHNVDEVAFAVVGDDRATTGFTPDGFFTFTTHDDDYRLLVTLQGIETEYQNDVKFLELVTRQAGRRHPVSVALGTTEIRFDTPAPVPALAAGATVIVASTGVWTCTDTHQASVMYVQPWRAAQPVDSELGLLTADDRVFLYAFEPCAACSEPYRSLTRVLDASVIQVDGERAVVNEPLRVPTERSDVAYHVARADELARVAPAFPATQTGTATWGIDSVPSLALGPIGRLPLVASSVGVGNSDGTVAVSNVFAGTTVVGWLETSFVRELAASPTAVIPLVHGTRHIVPVDAGQLAITGTIGIPAPPTIDGVPDGDDGSIAVGDTDPVASWQLAVDGPVDDHVLTVFEIDGASLVARRTIVTAHRHAPLSRTLFAPGHRYIVRVEARLGLPKASTGNFLKTSYPYATATTWSPAFTVR
jgi:hypothetical protein